MNYTLGAIYSQSCQVNAVCATPDYNYVLLLGADGIIRKLDFFSSLNGKLPSGTLAKRSTTETSLKEAFITLQWSLVSTSLEPEYIPIAHTSTNASKHNATSKDTIVRVEDRLEATAATMQRDALWGLFGMNVN